MDRHTVYRVILLVSVWCLTVLPVCAQNNKKANRAIQTVPENTTKVTGELRTALVIGNAAYLHVPPLKNPLNDATDIAKALKQMGFDVTQLMDARRNEMLQAIEQFGQKLQQGGTGLFFFAGHGMQVKSQNYLVPIDAPVDPSLLEHNMVPVESVVESMEKAKNAVNLIILDACRNNPFPSKSRSGQQGLAQMQAPNGSLVAFAASPNQTASDGNTRNGVYTAHLLKHMGTPGLSVLDVFMNVRNDVEQATQGAQIPQEWTTLRRNFAFVPAGQSAPPLTVAERPDPLPSSVPPPSSSSSPSVASSRPSQVASLPPLPPASQARSIYIDADHESRYLVTFFEAQLREKNLTLLKRYDGSAQSLKILLRTTAATETSGPTKMARLSVNLTVQDNTGNELDRRTQVVHGSASTDFEGALRDAARIWASTIKQEGVIDAIIRPR